MIYEYLCPDCEKEFTVEQKIGDDPKGTCPICNTETYTRLISPGSFVLKGGGWAKTGYDK